MTTEEEQRVWVLYLTTIVGWAMHPGRKLTVDEQVIREAGDLADLMLIETRKRYGLLGSSSTGSGRDRNSLD